MLDRNLNSEHLMIWSIDFLKCLPKLGSATNYVVECGWRCTAIQDGQSTGAYGVCTFTPPASPEGEFTPYDKLTEAAVLDWCFQNGVDKAEVEANVARQLDALVNPTEVRPPLPWVKA